jgi:hypothetical protein
MPRRAGIRTGTRPVVAIIDPGLVYRERLQIPLWLSLAGLALRALALLLVRLARLALRFWPLTVAAAAALWLWLALGRAGLVTVAVVVACLLLAFMASGARLGPRRDTLGCGFGRTRGRVGGADPGGAAAAAARTQ